MITLASGAYLFRTASIFSYNADFTVTYVFKRASASNDSTGFAISAANNQDDLDGTYLDASFTMGAYQRVATVQTGSQTGASVVSVSTNYFAAFQRSGNTLLTFLGTTPGNVKQEVSVAASFGARTAATQIVFNGWIQSVSHGHFDQLGRVRCWTAAIGLNEIRRELGAVNAVRTANLWSDWPLSSPLDLADRSGNARDLSSSGTVTAGERLGPMVSFL